MNGGFWRKICTAAVLSAPNAMHTNQLLLAGTINLCFDKIAKSCCTVSIKLLLLIVGKEIAHLKRIVPIAAFDYQTSQPSTMHCNVTAGY